MSFHIWQRLTGSNTSCKKMYEYGWNKCFSFGHIKLYWSIWGALFKAHRSLRSRSNINIQCEVQIRLETKIDCCSCMNTGYILEWWATLTSRWDCLSQYMCEKLFHFIYEIQCFNFLKQGTKLKAWVCRCIHNSDWLWESYPVMQGWFWGNESLSKMLINRPLFQTKTANNSLMHIGTIMIFVGILEDVLPINNQNKFWLCNFRWQSKSGITGFFKRLHYSIYKPSQEEDVVLWVTHHCIT